MRVSKSRKYVRRAPKVPLLTDYDHKPVCIDHPQDAIGHGLALVSEDRQVTGLIPFELVTQENVDQYLNISLD